jgi:hypothetical protein
MNFIADNIYPDLQKLATLGYEGFMLTKWRGGVMVEAKPQQTLCLKDAQRLWQAGVLDKDVLAT